MDDEKLLDEFFKLKNIRIDTMKNYSNTLKIFSDYNNMTLTQLLDEAQREDNENISWENSKLRERLIGYSEYLQDRYENRTARTYFNRVTSFYQVFQVYVFPIPTPIGR